jgi:hypothetical protein
MRPYTSLLDIEQDGGPDLLPGSSAVRHVAVIVDRVVGDASGLDRDGAKVVSLSSVVLASLSTLSTEVSTVGSAVMIMSFSWMLELT